MRKTVTTVAICPFTFPLIAPGWHVARRGPVRPDRRFIFEAHHSTSAGSDPYSAE